MPKQPMSMDDVRKMVSRGGATIAGDPVRLAPSAGTVTPIPTPTVQKDNIKIERSRLDMLNKTERRFYDKLILENKFPSVLPLAFTLWLSTKTRYTPDLVCLGGLKAVIYEIKGPYIYPRSLNKFKACITIFPCFSFRLAQWKNGEWHITEFK